MKKSIVFALAVIILILQWGCAKSGTETTIKYYEYIKLNNNGTPTMLSDGTGQTMTLTPSAK